MKGVTQDDLDTRQERDEGIYRKRTLGALAIITSRLSPRAKYANWDVGWEREAALLRNDPYYRRAVVAQARAMGVVQ